MATLKEDSGSYKAQSVKHKEYRHSPVSSKTVRKGAKKDTERWCKGVVGREHEWERAVPKNIGIYLTLRRDVCKNCNKQNHRTTEYLCNGCGEWTEIGHSFKCEAKE
jgi:hypothetical protein